MARYYQRPENALKKANEFIEVGKPTRALDTLYDVIKGKKHRAFSEKVIEPIMLKYLELCVELKKPHTAKEGLYQYRLMCQSVNVGLLEKVIRSFVKMAEERTDLARESLKTKVLLEEQQAIVEVDDLDNVSMADMTLLNVITEEQAQERSDRAVLIPWVKFLWESYTQCLDLLRNNARLENLYHDIAQMAFKFCLSYNRKTEFRKLCERLRKHFDDIVNRSITQINSIDFSSAETQQLNMETRLSQLDSAITMELWQEAYKAIEDIHLLMNQSRKSQTRMMAYYYQKLSLVFWKAGNLLFHAATLLKYYMLCKDMKKNVSQEEMQKNATQVVLATLAIPFPVAHPEFERFVETDKGMMEKAQKLATLLFLPQPPTRASMMRDLKKYGLLANSVPKLQELHELLETEFNPLGLCTNVNNIVTEVMAVEDNDYLQQYIEPLQDVALVRLIKQVSQVYQSIDYSHFLSMTVFATHTRLEQLLVDAVRYNDMQITIDHRSHSIRFGASLAEASREDLPEGPHLQDMPSENVRLQLVNVFNYLEDTLDLISPPHVIAEENKLRNKINNHYILTEKQNHIHLIQRQKIIADRREELERTAVDKENEEKWRSEQVVKQQMLLEQKRLESEREEREKKKLENDRIEFQQRRMKEKIAQIGQTPLGMLIVSKMKEDEMGNMDVEAVLQRQQEEMAKEAKEHMAKMKAQEKRYDHVERAKRSEEIPVIEKFMNEKKEFEKKDWEAHEIERITHLIEDRKVAVATRDRMKRMIEDKDEFLKTLLESRRHIFLAKAADFEKRLNDEKGKRLRERKEQRKEEKRQKHMEEKEEEERRKADELRIAEEEKAREERDIMEKEIAEKNRITLEKQIARQREIFEKDKVTLQSQTSLQQQSSQTSLQQQPVEPWRSTRSSTTTLPASERSSTTSITSSGTPQSTGWVAPSLAQKRALATKSDYVRDDSEGRPPISREREGGRERDFGRDRDSAWERDGGRGERDGGRGERDGGRGEREGGRGERDGVRGERDGGRGERDGFRGERDGFRGERDGFRGERDGFRGERDGFRGERDGFRGERDGFRGERDGFRGEREGFRGEREGFRGEREGGRGERDGLRGERDGLRGERDGGRGERDGGRGERDMGRDRDGVWDIGRERELTRDREAPQGDDSWRSQDRRTDTGRNDRPSAGGFRRDERRDGRETRETPRDQDFGGTDDNWRKPVKKESTS